MPKYFVSAHAEIKSAEAASRRPSPESSPSCHSTTANSHNASIGTSQVTPVAQTRKTGVRTAAQVATTGRSHVRCASR